MAEWVLGGCASLADADDALVTEAATPSSRASSSSLCPELEFRLQLPEWLGVADVSTVTEPYGSTAMSPASVRRVQTPGRCARNADSGHWRRDASGDTVENVTRLEEVAENPLLDAGQRAWTWGDLFLAARLWGEWEPWIAGLADRPAPADPKAAEVSFRRARRLIAGDELRAWLAEQHLTVDDWRGWLRGEPGEPWTAGVCDGSFDLWADRLAERAGALAAADPPPASTSPPAAWFGRMPGAADAQALGIPADAVALRAEALWSAERAYEQLCAEAAGGDAVERLVTDNSVDWLRVDCELIEAADEDVAREAALLVREDGLAMPEVARSPGCRSPPTACTSASCPRTCARASSRRRRASWSARSPSTATSSSRR